MTAIIEENNYFFIEGAPAHGSGPSIPIAIATVEKTRELTESLFPSLFESINKTTLTPLYPNGCPRDNHDGTHSARQARMIKVLFDKIKGPELSLEEKVHLILGAYLLRSGRIDESSHHAPFPDDYNLRSAMIYEAYAGQFQASPETISWVKNLIENSCKPVDSRDSVIDEDPKSKFAWDCLCLVHELDLIRCYGKFEIDTRIKPKVATHLEAYTEDSSLLERLFAFSSCLCEATGCSRTYDFHKGDTNLFQECSQSGKRCWETVLAKNLEDIS